MVPSRAGDDNDLLRGSHHSGVKADRCVVGRRESVTRIFLRFEEMLWTGKETGFYLPEADLDEGYETQLDRRKRKRNDVAS